MVRLEYDRLTGNDRRLKTLRRWILTRRAAGWGWPRIKATASFREWRRRGGR